MIVFEDQSLINTYYSFKFYLEDLEEIMIRWDNLVIQNTHLLGDYLVCGLDDEVQFLNLKTRRQTQKSYGLTKIFSLRPLTGQQFVILGQKGDILARNPSRFAKGPRSGRRNTRLASTIPAELVLIYCQENPEEIKEFRLDVVKYNTVYRLVTNTA